MLRPDKHYGVRTRAIHAGERPDPATHASAPNLVMSTTFVLDEAGGSFSGLCSAGGDRYVYTRWANPTVRQLEEKLASLEGGEAAVAFSTGMGAATGLLLHRLAAGDHLVVSDVTYAGVAELVRDTFTKLHIEVSPADLSDPDDLRRVLRPNTRMIWAETPANPILKLTDIRCVAEIAHEAGAELVVDSTFATPLATRPLELGADYVVHSLTKYIGGHGDALGGAVIGLRGATGPAAAGHGNPFGSDTQPLQRLAHPARHGNPAVAYGGACPKRNPRRPFPGVPSQGHSRRLPRTSFASAGRTGPPPDGQLLRHARLPG